MTDARTSETVPAQAREPRLCSACYEGRHWDCSGSVRCECDCDMEAMDYGHDPDLDENNVCRVCGKFEPE